jgi:hypothetical protein
MDEEQYKEPKDEVTKVFEDDNILIVSPLTIEANMYYGQKSPWYEDGYYGGRDFETKRKVGGKIYYIINKKTGEKESFYKDQYGKCWYNQNSRLDNSEVEDFINFAPSAKKLIQELTGNETFKKLRQFAKGQIDEDILTRSDDLIYDIIVNKNSPGDSKIILEFDNDDDFFNVLDLSDDDIWFLNAIMSRDYDFKSSDSMWDDNKEGYGLFRWFNDENTNKLRQIASIVFPSEEFDNNSENYLGKLYRALDERFSNELDRMNWELIDGINVASSENARKSIGKELNDYLEEKGFELERTYDRISTTVADLVYLYSVKGLRYADINTLLESELKPKDKYNLGGWSENYYDYEVNVEDEKALNSEFENQLDKILDAINEDNNLKEYFELVDNITSKYKLNTWHSTPKDDNIIFKIKRIDPETLKIMVELNQKDKSVWGKTHYFSEENFNKFLHQPELFSIFHED